MSGSDGNPQVTSVTKQEPWHKPYLIGGMNEAASLYANGKLGGNYYPGATYIAPTANEVAGYNSIVRTASSGNPLLSPLMGQAKEMLSQGGMSDAQNRNLGAFDDVARGRRGSVIDTGDDYARLANAMGRQGYLERAGNRINTRINTGDDYAQAARESARDSVSERSLMDTAMGRNIGRNNEHLMQVLDRSAGRAGTAVSSAMSGAGRYGSGAHQGTLAREVGDLYSRGLAQQMNLDLDRQMGAAGQIDGQRNAQMGARLAALGGQTGVQQQNINNRIGLLSQMDQARMARSGMQMSALGGQTQVQGANIANRVGAAQSLQDIYGNANKMALAWGAMAPQLDAMRYASGEKLLAAGAAQRGELQNELQENINRFQSKDNYAANQLARYMQMIQGVPSGYGSTTTSAPRGSALAGLLGGAATGASAGAGFGPWGAALGGLLGGGMGYWS